jgi:hypothetical protein
MLAWELVEHVPRLTAGNACRVREYHLAVGDWVFDEDLAKRGVQCPYHLRMRSTLARPDEEPGFAFCVNEPGHDGPHRHSMKNPPPVSPAISVWLMAVSVEAG